MNWACGCCSLLRLWWREVWAPWPETPALSQRPRQRWPTPCGRPWTTWRAWLRASSVSAQPAAALGGRDVPSPSLQLLLLPHRPHRKQPSLSRRWGGRNAPSPRSPSPPPPPHRPTTPMFRGRLHVVILRLFLFFFTPTSGSSSPHFYQAYRPLWQCTSTSPARGLRRPGWGVICCLVWLKPRRHDISDGEAS